ncbi:MAG: transketolase family protein [Firmicutes bacterium]|nr:transketolase family protein [Bacillota bacterium]
MMKTYGLLEKLGNARPDLDNAMQKYAVEHPEFRLISADVGRAGMPEFIQKFPKQYYNTGIAEMAAMDLASGLALEGFKPWIYGMSVFNTLRAGEGIRTNICYQHANVKIVGCNTGLCQGPCGSTHYALEDLAILRTFPTLTLCVPCDATQAVKAFEAANEMDGPVYIRLGNGRNESEVYMEDYRFEFGKGIEIAEGEDGYIIACGMMVPYAVEAAKQLKEEGIEVGVVDMHTLKPVDKDLIFKAAKKTGKIVTVEDAFIIGGLGGAVCETVAESGIACRVKRLGVPDLFPGFGTFNDQMDHLGFGVEAMKEAIKTI